MDSIDKNQPKDNFNNLTGQGAIDKIKEFAEQAQTCFSSPG
jgi:hypothetical protein